jgi:hypothetical protein
VNAHVLDVRVAALITFYAALLGEAVLRTPGGGTPIAVPASVREETLQLAREVLATVPRTPAEVTA